MIVKIFKKISFCLIIFTFVQCTKGDQQIHSIERESISPPRILGFVVEDFISETDSEGRKERFTEKTQDIVFTKYIHTWSEREPLFLDKALQKKVLNIPTFKVKLQDADSTDNKIIVEYSLNRISKEPFQTPWNRALPVYERDLEYHSEIKLSLEKLGRVLQIPGEGEYVLRVVARDVQDNRSDIYEIPFKIKCLNPKIKVKLDLNFQQKSVKNITSFWSHPPQTFFTPLGIQPQEGLIEIKRYKLSSDVSNPPLFFKLKAHMNLLYHYLSSYVDVGETNPTIYEIHNQPENLLDSEVYLKRQDKELEKIDSQNSYSWIEGTLQPGEELELTVSSSLRYLPQGKMKRETLRYDIKPNHIYHTLEINPYFEIFSVPLELKDKLSQYDERWYVEPYDRKDKIVYVQKAKL